MTLEVLCDALAQLARSSGAAFCAVSDTGAMLYAAGGDVPYPSDLLGILQRVHDAEIHPRISSMRRGVRVSVARDADDTHYFVRSFAATYVLLVWFGQPFEEARVASFVDRTLPRIQALTLGLPPVGGPGHDAGAVKKRA